MTHRRIVCEEETFAPSVVKPMVSSHDLYSPAKCPIRHGITHTTLTDFDQKENNENDTKQNK
jgi:hypothetical protein